MIYLDQIEEVKPPHPEPFEGMSISPEELHLFIADSLKAGKQPVIIFGANWCPDAKYLAGVLELPSVKNFIDRHFLLLHVDVGKYERNTELFNFFDSAIQDGIPRIFILNHADHCANQCFIESLKFSKQCSIKCSKQSTINCSFINTIIEAN